MRPVVRFHSTLLFMAFTWMASELLAAKVEGTGDYVMPSWFKNSFLDLKDDINEASSSEKRGVSVKLRWPYFIDHYFCFP